MAGQSGEASDPHIGVSGSDRPKRSVWPWILTLVISTFTIGLLASPWLEDTVRSRLSPPFNEVRRPANATADAGPALTDQRPVIAPLAAAAPDDAERAALVTQGERIAALERRFDALDARSSTALANSSRAEGMLLTLAARRALDTGQPLGVIEGMLRERFGGSQPQAVAALIATGQKPVTLGQLQAGLQTLEPQLQQASRGDSWWNELRGDIAGLILIKRQNEPMNGPAEQITDARQRLMMGDVAGALWQVNRLPANARGKAAAWVVGARRYLIARQALDTLETVSLLAPPPGEAERVIPLPSADKAPLSRSAPATGTAQGG